MARVKAAWKQKQYSALVSWTCHVSVNTRLCVLMTLMVQGPWARLGPLLPSGQWSSDGGIVFSLSPRGS